MSIWLYILVLGAFGVIVFLIMAKKLHWMGKEEKYLIPIVVSDDDLRFNVGTDNRYGYITPLGITFYSQTVIEGDELLFIGDALDGAMLRLNRNIAQVKITGTERFYKPLLPNVYLKAAGDAHPFFITIVDYTRHAPIDDVPAIWRADIGFVAGTVLGLLDRIINAPMMFLPRVREFTDPRLRQYFHDAAYNEREHFATIQDLSVVAAQAANDVHPIYKEVAGG